MEHINLVRYLSEEAADLIRGADGASPETAGARLDEAAELLHLGVRILSRQTAGGGATEGIREAA